MNGQRIRLGVVVVVALAAIGFFALRSDDDPAEDVAADRNEAADDPRTDEGSPGDGSLPNTGDQPDSAQGEDVPRDDADAGVGDDEADGTINEEAEVIVGNVADPVALDETTGFGDGVSVHIAQFESVQTEARLPGERSGPGVAVTLEMINGSGSAVSLDSVTVDLVTSDGASAIRIVDPSREEFSGNLGLGEKGSGTYVFTIPPDQRSDIAIHIKYSADTPVVVFQGNAPGA